MIILQHDWFEAFAQNESAWCTYKGKEKTVHGTVTKNHSKEFNISKSDREITVGFENTKTTFLSPCRRFDADSFTFRFLDVSPNESLFVKNGENKVEVFDVDRHEIRKEVQFISTPQLVRFFPSGKVLLVADYNQLKVVDIATGTVARTLIGHSGEINQTQFIGPGRNIVSFSSDGTCKLWEMSSAECIATILDGGSGPINSGLVVSGKKLYEKPEKFFGEGNEFCWIGTESGKLIGKELFGDGVFSEELDSAINAMCYSEGRLFVGTQKGTLYRVVTNDFQVLNSQKV